MGTKAGQREGVELGRGSDGSWAASLGPTSPKPGQTPSTRQVSDNCCSYLAGKHPPEGGDDSLRGPYGGHHRGKGPVGGVQGDTQREGRPPEAVISEQPVGSLGPGNQRTLELGRARSPEGLQGA